MKMLFLIVFICTHPFIRFNIVILVVDEILYECKEMLSKPFDGRKSANVVILL